MTSSGSGSTVVDAVHVKPVSTTHVAEQPSNDLRLPSSQASPAWIEPSPQTASQTPSTHFGSRVHSGVQPSPRSLFWSSHCSVPCVRPSLHVVVSQAWPGVAHWKPASSAQAAEQPAVAALASSHSSKPATMPSPQAAAVHRQVIYLRRLKAHSVAMMHSKLNLQPQQRLSSAAVGHGL